MTMSSRTVSPMRRAQGGGGPCSAGRTSDSVESAVTPGFYPDLHSGSRAAGGMTARYRCTLEVAGPDRTGGAVRETWGLGSTGARASATRR